jgi:hypothetical protein
MNAPLEQQMASVATRWDAMRELVGEAWEDDLTDVVFGALYINKERTLPTPTPENLGKVETEWLPRDILDNMIAEAMDKCDGEFFTRLSRSMEALAKVWPNGLPTKAAT